MVDRHHVFLVIFILLAISLNGQIPYRFSFKISGGARGRILLIIPYRFYYEASAAIDFLATRRSDGTLDFRYADLPEAGYMMRTTGFSGRSVIILTAHYKKERHLPAANRVFEMFLGEASEYSRRVKRVFKHPFEVIYGQNYPFGFTRCVGGIHHDVYDHILLNYAGGAKKFKVYFNVYKIMAALLQVYDHSCLPNGGRGKLLDMVAGWDEETQKIEWRSAGVNLSSALNRVAGKASRMAERYADLRQESEFHLNYSLAAVNHNYIELTGEARPNAIVSGDLAITRFSRRVRLSADELHLQEDTITVEILTPGGKGGSAILSLRKSDS
jgi:hypothetical protein